MTKLHVSAANAPIRIDVYEGQPIINEFRACLKRDRPSVPKDKKPRKRKEAKNIDGQVEDNQKMLVAPKEPSLEELLSLIEISFEENAIVPEETQAAEICENNEI